MEVLVQVCTEHSVVLPARLSWHVQRKKSPGRYRIAETGQSTIVLGRVQLSSCPQAHIVRSFSREARVSSCTLKRSVVQTEKQNIATSSNRKRAARLDRPSTRVQPHEGCIAVCAMYVLHVI